MRAPAPRHAQPAAQHHEQQQRDQDGQRRAAAKRHHRGKLQGERGGPQQRRHVAPAALRENQRVDAGRHRVGKRMPEQGRRAPVALELNAGGGRREGRQTPACGEFVEAETGIGEQHRMQGHGEPALARRREVREQQEQGGGREKCVEQRREGQLLHQDSMLQQHRDADDKDDDAGIAPRHPIDEAAPRRAREGQQRDSGKSEPTRGVDLFEKRSARRFVAEAPLAEQRGRDMEKQDGGKKNHPGAWRRGSHSPG